MVWIAELADVTMSDVLTVIGVVAGSAVAALFSGGVIGVDKGVWVESDDGCGGVVVGVVDGISS